MVDNNLDKLNYNSIDASLTVNNFITTFQYLEEDGESETKVLLVIKQNILLMTIIA